MSGPLSILAIVLLSILCGVMVGALLVILFGIVGTAVDLENESPTDE